MSEARETLDDIRTLLERAPREERAFASALGDAAAEVEASVCQLADQMIVLDERLLSDGGEELYALVPSRALLGETLLERLACLAGIRREAAGLVVSGATEMVGGSLPAHVRAADLVESGSGRRETTQALLAAWGA